MRNVLNSNGLYVISPEHSPIYSSRGETADFAGRIAYNDNGEEIFTFGKYKGQVVSEVFTTEPTYYDWMMKGDFPQYTKKIITEIKLRNRKF